MFPVVGVRKPSDEVLEARCVSREIAVAWTTMHFAVGMLAGGAAGVAVAALRGRGSRWVPAAMTFGGLWALAPDLPRVFREDFPWLPMASVLGSKELERQLHAYGDVFVLHARLDAQPNEYALHGLILILLLYNAALLWQLLYPPRPLLRTSERRNKRRRSSRSVSRRPVLSEHLEDGSDAEPAEPAVIGRIDPKQVAVSTQRR